MSDLARYLRFSQSVLWLVNSQTEGLTHADSLLTASPYSNSLNWILGHMVAYRQNMLKLLGDEEPLLEPDMWEVYKRGAAQMTAASSPLPLEELVAKFRHSQERLEAALSNTTADFLAQPHRPDQTKGQWLDFLQWHEAYHGGQLEFGRQLAGKSEPVI